MRDAACVRGGQVPAVPFSGVSWRAPDRRFAVRMSLASILGRTTVRRWISLEIVSANVADGRYRPGVCRSRSRGIGVPTPSPPSAIKGRTGLLQVMRQRGRIATKQHVDVGDISSSTSRPRGCGPGSRPHQPVRCGHNGRCARRAGRLGGSAWPPCAGRCAARRPPPSWSSSCSFLQAKSKR